MNEISRLEPIVKQPMGIVFPEDKGRRCHREEDNEEVDPTIPRGKRPMDQRKKKEEEVHSSGANADDIH